MFDRESIMNSVSACITERLQQKNMKAAELAKRSGVTQAAISQIINKKRCMTVPLLMKVCFVLDVPIGTMIGYENAEREKVTKEASNLTEQINELTRKREELLSIN